MKIICAPDSFKESLSATEVAEAMVCGIRCALPNAQVDLCPIADGGEGTVDTMLAAVAGRILRAEVSDPLGRQAQADWGLLSDGHTAVIEMAAASGLALVEPQHRDPTKTSTYGTGQLIRASLDAGVQRVIVGIGGSATNDGGCGAAQALGVRFFDLESRLIEGPISGGQLERIAHIDMAERDPRLDRTAIVVACDVTNPLIGPNGAAAVYGPQKGASRKQVTRLDSGLSHLGGLLSRDLKCEVEQMSGAGAAGGLGAGMVAFFGATLQPGVRLVLETVGFDSRLEGCDLCLTGEGRLDGQSLSGKACLGVAAVARHKGVPTIALVGSLGPDAQRTLEAGLSAYHVIGEGLSKDESIRRAGELVEQTTAEVLRAMSGPCRAGK